MNSCRKKKTTLHVHLVFAADVNLPYQNSRTKSVDALGFFFFYVSESIYGDVWAQEELLVTPTHCGFLHKPRMQG